jgi:citrate synthase
MDAKVKDNAKSAPISSPPFACTRISGWCAHYIEQVSNNRIYRPLSKYIGPPLRKVTPIGERG